ncbi:MAG: ferritin family protein [Planctomycetota bacterium]
MPTRLNFAKLDLMDALDLAALIESEAHERYASFAARLGRRSAGDAASVFASMAENEAKHGRQLLARRKTRFGDAPSRVSRDDLYDVEAPDVGSARSNMSTRRAYEVALEAEQKAHDFYELALVQVVDPSIRKLFAELRDEETEHVRMVRQALAGLPPSADEEWEEDEDDLPSL